MHRIVMAIVLALFVLTNSLLASDKIDVSNQDVNKLKREYETWVEKLGHERIAHEYSKAVKQLDSDSDAVLVGLQTLAASGEPAAIPWIIPHLDAKDLNVLVWAGASLSKIVSSHELKRRDQGQQGKVVIKPRGPGDLDLRPLAWVILHMLQKPDDGNTHGYAATMIGYLGLKEFEPDLRTLLDSRHPAVTNAAKNALDMLEASPLVSFSEEELEQAKLTGEAFADLFRKNDEGSLGLLLLPKVAIRKVINPKVLKNDKPKVLFEKMVTANMMRFREFRAMFSDLSKTSTITFQEGELIESDFYANDVRVMKNSYVTLAYANRIVIRIKIEEMVFVDDKCYIVEID